MASHLKVSDRFDRWALEIQSYDIKIYYSPGKMNIVSNLLSRLVCDHKEESSAICIIQIVFSARKANGIREEQLKDYELKNIIDCFDRSVKDVTESHK
ncbi:hypothetical protein CDAR_404891 [Caerostris darwini]|uniref:Integrase n=1 Tax=Caerostris darwini TaxID=1538125 RepID=A0AAV4U4Z7_9ARAC|nr:hypothetical protein CDAR_404891 [Caerostris darwini]